MELCYTSIEAGLKKALCESRKTKCNVRSVGAVLFLEDLNGEEDVVYFGHNGNESDPCIGKECRRSLNNGEDECPSLCAEGYCINKAVEDGKNLKGGVIVCTDLPCERCIGLIEKYEIKDVCFWKVKTGVMRPIDDNRIGLLNGAGVNVYRFGDLWAKKIEVELYG